MTMHTRQAGGRLTRRALMLALVGGCLASIACGSGGCGIGLDFSTHGIVAGPSPSDAAAGFPRTLTDSTGQALTLAAPPRRIVSQTLGTDEILFAICPRDRIVGLSALARDAKYSNITREADASNIPKAYSPEDILRLKPDLIFVASYSRAETVELLRASGAPVFRFAAFERIEDLFDNVTIVGRATGEEAAAAALLTTARQRLVAARARVPAGQPAPRVLSLDSSNTTAGANTLFDDVVTHAGAINLAAEKGVKGFGQVSSEQVLAWQPDYIVIGVDEGQEETARQALARDPAIGATRAVRAGRVIGLSNRRLLTTSHYIVDTVEGMVDALHGAGAR